MLKALYKYGQVFVMVAEAIANVLSKRKGYNNSKVQNPVRISPQPRRCLRVLPCGGGRCILNRLFLSCPLEHVLHPTPTTQLLSDSALFAFHAQTMGWLSRSGFPFQIPYTVVLVGDTAPGKASEISSPSGLSWGGGWCFSPCQMIEA